MGNYYVTKEEMKSSEVKFKEICITHLSNVQEEQERFIDKIVEQIIKDAKSNLDKIFEPSIIDKYENLFDFSCYELALMMIKIAAKHTDEYPTHWGFNKRCKEFEDILYGDV
jgi:hypothetical protein